ncbi:MAG: hypothetical protein QOJ29_2158 [Thermoleophilaceae bacterium]|nr:hypothetical protein [Thermoleophilaceae bacterium]
MSSPVRVPPNTESTVGLHFRSKLGSGGTVVGGAIAMAIVFSIGAAAHNGTLMLGGPVAVAIAVVAICWFRAQSQAEDEFFNLWARSHGMTHSSKWSLNEFTPLLGGGDRRHCEHWMQTTRGERGIGWYTFEVKHENGDKPDTYEAHNFTLATTDMGEHGMYRFQGIYLRRRRGILDRLDTDANWLGKHRLKKVELESTAFCDTYELWADQGQDDIVLRQLFAPTFVVWLTEHPLKPGFELRAGQLVVFVPGHCGEAGKLEFLLMASAEISRRIQAELTEAAQAGSL